MDFQSLVLILSYILSHYGGFEILLIWSHLNSLPRIPPHIQTLPSKCILYEFQLIMVLLES